jgi:hypothetical protein
VSHNVGQIVTVPSTRIGAARSARTHQPGRLRVLVHAAPSARRRDASVCASPPDRCKSPAGSRVDVTRTCCEVAFPRHKGQTHAPASKEASTWQDF